MPSNPEKGPNNNSRSPEVRPGQVPLKDDKSRMQFLGGQAVKGATKDQKKGK